MSEEFFIIPSREKDYQEVTEDLELSRRKVQGKLFRKHVLNKGPLIHPRTKKVVQIDDEFVNHLVDNFNNGVCDIVQVPLATDSNEHSEDPDRNIGEVVDLKVENDKVYAYIDVRDKNAVEKMGTTYLGASAFLNLNYFDTSDGQRKGPTLLHTAVTNRPYVTGLEDYEEIVAATAANAGIDADNLDSMVLLTVESTPEVTDDTDNTNSTEEVEKIDSPVVAAVEEPPVKDETEENEMPKATLDELLAQLKEEHGIDVRGLQASTSEKEKELEDATALSNTLTDEAASAKSRAEELETAVKQLQGKLADVGILKLSNGEEMGIEDFVGVVAEVAQGHLALTNQVKELLEKDAHNEVLALSRAGFIEPGKVDVMTRIKLRDEEEFKELLPSKPIVEMKEETGVVPESVEEEFNVEDYITKLTQANPHIFGSAK